MAQFSRTVCHCFVSISCLNIALIINHFMLSRAECHAIDPSGTISSIFVKYRFPYSNSRSRRCAHRNRFAFFFLHHITLKPRTKLRSVYLTNTRYLLHMLKKNFFFFATALEFCRSCKRNVLKKEWQNIMYKMLGKFDIWIFSVDYSSFLLFIKSQQKVRFWILIWSWPVYLGKTPKILKFLILVTFSQNLHGKFFITDCFTDNIKMKKFCLDFVFC